MVQSGYWFTNLIYYWVFLICWPWVNAWSQFMSIWGEWDTIPMIELTEALGFPDMGEIN